METKIYIPRKVGGVSTYWYEVRNEEGESAPVVCADYDNDGIREDSQDANKNNSFRIKSSARTPDDNSVENVIGVYNVQEGEQTDGKSEIIIVGDGYSEEGTYVVEMGGDETGQEQAEDIIKHCLTWDGEGYRTEIVSPEVEETEKELAEEEEHIEQMEYSPFTIVGEKMFVRVMSDVDNWFRALYKCGECGHVFAESSLLKSHFANDCSSKDGELFITLRKEKEKRLQRKRKRKLKKLRLKRLQEQNELKNNDAVEAAIDDAILTENDFEEESSEEMEKELSKERSSSEITQRNNSSGDVYTQVEECLQKLVNRVINGYNNENVTGGECGV